MTELFCLHCNPPAAGKHEVSCPLFVIPPEAEEILKKVDNIYKRFAEITGIDLERVQGMNPGVVEKFMKGVNE